MRFKPKAVTKITAVPDGIDEWLTAFCGSRKLKEGLLDIAFEVQERVKNGEFGELPRFSEASSKAFKEAFKEAAIKAGYRKRAIAYYLWVSKVIKTFDEY